MLVDAECLYAECGYAESHFVECRGALNIELIFVFVLCLWFLPSRWTP